MAPTDIRTALLSRRDPAQPFVTHLGPDGRMELSTASIANAAAKIANAVVAEFDLQPGDSVGVHLPWHWQRVAWLLGIWSAGLQVVPGGGEECDLLIAGPQEATGLPGNVQVISTHPFGMPLDAEAMAQLPPGAEDVTLVVRSQPDAQVFVADHSTEIALDGMTQEELLQNGRVFAAEQLGVLRLGLTPGDRQWWLPAIWPLVSDGSVIMADEINDEVRHREQLDATSS